MKKKPSEQTPFFSSIEPLEARIAPATLTVLNLNDSGPGSLRDIVANSHAGDTVVFKSTLHGTIPLLSEIDITHKLTIAGPGASKIVLDGGNSTRIFNIDDGTPSDQKVTINNLGMIRGYESGSGGAIYSAESLSLSGDMISDCTASTSGGAVFAKALAATGAITVKNCTISGNTAVNAYTGGLYVYAAKNVQIANTVVSGNTSPNNGGAGIYAGIASSGTGISLSSVQVIENQAGGLGGGAWIANNSTSPKAATVVALSTFSGNKTTNAMGGGLYARGNTVITSSIFQNNTAPSGGGVAVRTDAHGFAMSNANVSGNHATVGTGGGLYLSGPADGTLRNAVVSSSRFDNNTSAANGGGVYLGHGFAATIIGGTINGNNAAGNGGGLASLGAAANAVNLKIVSTAINNNIASQDGGGIYANGDGTLSLYAAVMSGNTGHNGGGLYVSSTQSVLLSGVFATNNVATTGGYNGGGVYLNVNGPSGIFQIRLGLFANNDATNDGGGIYLTGNGKGSISMARVINNIASATGGGIFNGLSVPTNATLSGSTVTNNLALTDPDKHNI